LLFEEKPKLTKKALQKESHAFAARISNIWETWIYNNARSKRLGTFIEDQLELFLREGYEFTKGSSSKGIDFPELLVDVKTTDHRQPQSSAPFSSIREKIFGLGYAVLIFVYRIRKDHEQRKGRLEITGTTFIDAGDTGDTTLTAKLIDAKAFGQKEVCRVICQEIKRLRIDKKMISHAWIRGLITEVCDNEIMRGRLTISPALQWRVQYGKIEPPDYEGSIFDLFGNGSQ